MDSPTTALAVMIGAILAMGRLWAPRTLLGRLFHLAHPSLDVARARGAAFAATAVWLAISLGGTAPSVIGQACMAASFLVAWALIARWLRRERRTRRRRAGIIGTVAVVAALAAIQASVDGGVRIDALVLLPAVAVFALPVIARQGLGRVDWWEPVLGNPARFLVVTFAALCLAGTVVLALPASTLSGQGLALVDAAFTAVSAVCVTGLIVLDTPAVFSTFGLVAIAVLIQLGGLGIMTFSTAAMRLFGQRMSLRYEGMVASMMSTQDRSRLNEAARQILVLTAATELIGALLLAALFWQHGDAPLQALWRGLFTAVSAFCNAGFALQSDSLVGYQTAPGVLHVAGDHEPPRHGRGRQQGAAHGHGRGLVGGVHRAARVRGQPAGDPAAAAVHRRAAGRAVRHARGRERGRSVSALHQRGRPARAQAHLAGGESDARSAGARARP